MVVGIATTPKAPFPYFGGKSTVADIVWQRFGDVPNLIEPFFGSGAVLLRRPHEPGIETVNDKDCLIANFWRAVRSDPECIAYHCDYPAIESDLHARHAWLVGQRESLTERIEGNPDYFDTKIAGWWCWGMSLWIGHGFCSGEGPWRHVDGKLVKDSNTERGVQKQIIHLGDAGQGIQTAKTGSSIRQWMHALSERLRRVRVCCGDWSRVMGPSVTIHNGLTGIFLDPPYGVNANRNSKLYSEDSLTVSDDCRKWCIENGGNKLLRIALCGYVGEHEQLMEYAWQPYHWKARGGFGSQGGGNGRENRKKEVIWFSPHCLQDKQISLF